MKIRTYSELEKLKTFKERFDYLSLSGRVGNSTFGFERYFNQRFYTSSEWKHIRDEIISRDNGCDLGLKGYDIGGKIIIHHMNPVLLNDIVGRTDILTDPEYLVCVSLNTHNAIHYGNEETLNNQIIERTPNDMCPWKR